MTRKVNDPIRNIRDYTLENGYAYAGYDAGREVRGLFGSIWKLVRAIGGLIAAIVGREAR